MKYYVSKKKKNNDTPMIQTIQIIPQVTDWSSRESCGLLAPMSKTLGRTQRD
jgi:hypothetical protein